MVIAVMVMGNVIGNGDSDSNGNRDGDNGGDNDHAQSGYGDRHNGGRGQDEAKVILVVMMEMQSAEAVNDADDRGSQDENNIGKWLQ